MCKKFRNSTLRRRRPQPNRHPRIMSIIRDSVDVDNLSLGYSDPLKHVPAYQEILRRRKQKVEKS